MDVLDAHFCIVNTMFQSDVESGNDVRPEQHMHDAVCHNSEVMSSTTILVEGARLGVDEAEIPMIKKKACVFSKPFKAREWRPQDARNAMEERRRSRRVNTFGPDESKIRNGMWICQAEGAYVQHTLIVPSYER